MTNKFELEFEDLNYEGSKIFSSLAGVLGLSTDLTNFLITQLLALILASAFRSYLNPSKVTASVRHAYGLVFGLFFGYFCFGQQAIHIAGLPAACYIVIRTQNPQFVQRIVMVVSLGYLSCIHLHRQYKDYGSYSVDITGPLMIITQKVVSLAFSIHDGFTRETKQMTKSQQYHMVDKIPSPLEYFAYVLNFQSLMAGPLILYRDYIEFAEGCNIIKRSSSNGKSDDSTKQIMQEPSPVKSVVKKVVACLACAYIYMRFISVYPIKNIKDEAFLESHNLLYVLWYVMMCTTTVRFKYYFAWLLADAICNNAGLGFNGYNSDATPKWDLFTNIYVIPLELGTNFRDCINNWNIGTNLWLRMVVYERVPKKYATVLTFALSALWHGFYPGYYLTFASGALFVVAARKSRQMFRHRFQQTKMTRTFYDVITCIVSRFYISYTTCPFVLLEFGASLRMYLKLFSCLHLVALVTVFLLPKLIRSERISSTSAPANKKTDECVTDDGVDSKNDKLMTADRKVVDNKTRKQHSVNGGELDESSSSNSSCSSYSNSLNDISDKKHQRKSDTNYLLKDLINKEVNKIKGETDNLSNLLMGKIEAANIEGLIDKTVSGIVELKDDLMRMNEPEVYSGGAIDTLRKRNLTGSELETGGTTKASDGVDAFLKKEIDAIKEANVIPAVLSNGHAK